MKIELTKYGKFLLAIRPDDDPIKVVLKGKEIKLRKLDPKEYIKYYYPGSSLFKQVDKPTPEEIKPETEAKKKPATKKSKNTETGE